MPIPNYNSSTSFAKLGTVSIGAPNIGTYTLQGNMIAPSLSKGASANSQVVVTININGGGTIYTGQIGADAFWISPLVIAAANSIINVILTSAAAVDQGNTAVKTTINLSELS